MCLIHGLASGMYLIDEDVLTPDLATEAVCGCERAHQGTDARPGGAVSRRDLLSGSLKTAGGIALASALGTGALAKPSTAKAATGPFEGDGVLCVGVAGGPMISKAHKQPSLGLLVNGTEYLVDAGNDTAAQLVNANLPFPALRHVFLTHHHSDHMAGYPALAVLGWVQPQAYQRLEVWGPPPMNTMHDALLSLFSADIASRQAIPGPRLADLLYRHQVVLRTAGKIERIMQDDNVVVTSTRVFHGPDIDDAYAYRFDIKSSGKSVAFSGDCAPDDNLVRLAKDADLLIHEVLYWPGVEIILQSVDPSLRPALEEHFRTAHTNITDLPRIAKAANVKRVAFCHYLPSFTPPAVFLDAFQNANQTVGFDGEVIAPTELDFIAL